MRRSRFTEAEIVGALKEVAPNGDVIFTISGIGGEDRFYLLSLDTGVHSDLSRFPDDGDRRDDEFHGYCTR